LKAGKFDDKYGAKRVVILGEDERILGVVSRLDHWHYKKGKHANFQFIIGRSFDSLLMLKLMINRMSVKKSALPGTKIGKLHNGIFRELIKYL
jgi:hypothetical protein